VGVGGETVGGGWGTVAVALSAGDDREGWGSGERSEIGRLQATQHVGSGVGRCASAEGGTDPVGGMGALGKQTPWVVAES